MLPSGPGIIVYLDGIQDPGNLGALARSVEASGCSGLALSPGCAHPNHPRALRAAAGSLLRLALAVDVVPEELDGHLAEEERPWVALEATTGSSLYEADLPEDLILALGAEGPGLSARVRERADLFVHIPMARNVESLNVTVAGAVVLFELQRRKNEAAPRNR